VLSAVVTTKDRRKPLTVVLASKEGRILVAIKDWQIGKYFLREETGTVSASRSDSESERRHHTTNGWH
jgi:hypothetical protein